MPYQYNVNSPPQSGVGFAGAVPGAIDLPNPYQDINRHLPSIGPMNNAAGSDVLSQLHGQLSPETLARIQDASASFGVTSGMPGSGLQRNRTARDLGLSTEQLQNQGLQNYGTLLNTVSKTQTVSPELQAEIAGRNATLAAAPNPAAAASHAQDLFNQYLQGMGRGPQGGTGGGGGGGAPVSSGWGPSSARAGVGTPWASDRPSGPGITGPQGGDGAAPGPWYGNAFNYPRPGAGMNTPGSNDISGDMYNSTFGNPGSMDAGVGADLWDQSGSNFYGGTESGAPDWAQAYGDIGWGAPGSPQADTGQELWDLAGGDF